MTAFCKGSETAWTVLPVSVSLKDRRVCDECRNEPLSSTPPAAFFEEKLQALAREALANVDAADIHYGTTL